MQHPNSTPTQHGTNSQKTVDIDFDILVLSKTWLVHVPNNLNIPTYIFYNKSHKTNPMDVYLM